MENVVGNEVGNPVDSALALIETDLLVAALERRHGVDLRAYAGNMLCERLRGFCADTQIDTISALQGRVLRDEALALAVGRVLTSGASAMLNAAEAFTALRCAVLPLLRSASWPAIWISECADDGLVMRVAAMLAEEGLLEKSQIFVTHPNEDVLRDMARPRTALADAALREHIVWSQYDLATGGTFKECELVMCQRALSDFAPGMQRRALGLFQQSLCNFGILQVDAPQAVLANDLARDFICLLPDQGVYRRLPSAS